VSSASHGSGARAALFTDLYELTMAQAYVADAMADVPATFSLFVRTLPPQRNFLLAAGLDTALAALEGLRFSPDDLAYLRSLGRFTPAFLDWLRAFRFQGSVVAVAEGTPVFAGEPLLEVTAQLAQAQIVETLLINELHLQTMLASKAARIVTAAQGRRVIDFGARRFHGVDASVNGARALAIAGVAATSNLLAGRTWGLPVVGTMAHAYVQSFASEAEAFRAFARHYPDTTLLVDTYDTLDGVRRVIALARELGTAFRVQAVRLDSGDLAVLAKGARSLLDGAGLASVRIFASGGLDEHTITALLAAGAPIDAFGVGTRMGVSEDAPALDVVYKLTALAGQGRVKLSPGKNLLPGQKQMWRVEEDGVARRDVLGRATEKLQGRPLLQPVMEAGSRIGAPPSLADIAAHAQRELGRLPPALRALAPVRYPVDVTPALAAYAQEVGATHA
jgi:nicotinate phosphoribosyltransferase